MSFLDQFSLARKTALVTGSNTGLGQAMAIALAEAGANVVGTSNTGVIKGGDTEKAITALGRTFDGYQLDISNRDALYQFISDVKATHTIDILVNNAGMIMRKPAAEHPDEYWDKVISVNLDAQFILAREFGKDMIARGSGKIIFTCSLLSFQGGINVPAYTASKSAVAGLVKALSNEWASKGVNVNGIAPGYIVTNNTEALRADPDRSKSILDRIPAGRWGEPDDFKGPVVFLASAAGAYVHGTTLTVDGGWMGR
ncbi:SDR family NAD(P)-dependent oxidoreductase [Spirosoma foliorum]|uniref:SDR family oxidoreductase n=1 Tax=Spirosoma foliorum TaxID=2710596 RepID=A0A7G5GZF6_9BACT|nr:SDR family NAD(P)-dependent oxidoreductase [Spirosoma foliorum]QMW04248.1 SDR family oxidoreductase [Spirosoma foliorum]